MKLTIDYTCVRVASDPDYGRLSEEELRGSLNGKLIYANSELDLFGEVVEPGFYTLTYDESGLWLIRVYIPNGVRSKVVGDLTSNELRGFLKKRKIVVYDSGIDWRPEEMIPEDFYVF